MTKEHISWKEELMYAKWCTMSNLAVPISRLYDFMDWILCSDDCWLVQTWQMLCGLKTILTDMNILNSYRHIRPKKGKIPDTQNTRWFWKKIGYSCPSLVWSNTEKLISRPFLGENQFWWVLQKRMGTEDAVGCFLFRSHSLLFCIVRSWPCSKQFLKRICSKRPKWISHLWKFAFLLYNDSENVIIIE